MRDTEDPRYLPLEMPDKYVREMVADWAGAGKAITGTWEFKSWYEHNAKSVYIFHENTKSSVEYYVLLLHTILNEKES